MTPPNRKNSRSSRLDGYRTELSLMPEEERSPPTFSPPSSSVTTTTTTSASSPASASASENDNDPSTFPPPYSPSSSSSSASSSGSSSPPRPRPSLSHSTSHPFFPPFYNRPPTPLPPSPSLTSLLRPPFSTTTSRPTTPDSSDADTPTSTSAAIAKSARSAVSVPRASPQVPTYEYYGFVLYVGSSACFVMYALWAYLPSPFLHQLGIDYYPNRWWALALPAELVVALVYIYAALAGYNTGTLTLPMSSVENIVDEAANVAVLDERGRIVRRGGGAARVGRGGRAWEGSWAERWSEGTDAVMDVPVGGVCEILYGDGRGLECCRSGRCVLTILKAESRSRLSSDDGSGEDISDATRTPVRNIPIRSSRTKSVLTGFTIGTLCRLSRL
ncbi:hypothetical protein MMC11_004192 [Xylographa trunciseda]|nr:hypothetical protein [Xylographa trunciseda]